MSVRDGSALCHRVRCPNKLHCRGLCAKHYRQWRQHRISTGAHLPGLVDPLPAIEHIKALQHKGLSFQLLWKLSGVHADHLRALPRRTYITANTQAKILAVPIPAAAHQVASDGARVPTLGTTRRLQGLVAMGHSQRVIAERCGILETNLAQLVSGRQAFVSAANARRIEAAFDRLQFEPGGNRRSLNRAGDRSYVHAWAWDADTIDDPTARPHPTTPVAAPKPTRGQAIPFDFSDIVAEHRELGRSDQNIADRLGLKLDTLQSRMRRLERRAS